MMRLSAFFLFGMVWLWGWSLFAQPTSPGVTTKRLVGTQLVGEMLQVEVVDSTGAVQTHVLPQALLLDLILKFEAVRQQAAQASPLPRSRGVAAGEDAAPTSETNWFRGSFYSPQTEYVYNVYMVAGGMVQVNYEESGQTQSFELPARVLTSMSDAYAKLGVLENKFEFLQDGSQLWFLLSRSLNVWGMLLGFGVLVFGATFGLFKRRLDRLQRERDELEASRRRMVEAREAERKFLSAELHDGPIQDLQRVVRSYVRPLRKEVQEEALAEHIGAVHEALMDVTSQIRSICKRLIPPVLIHFGLDRAIHSLTEDLSLDTGLTFTLELDPEKKSLALPVRLALFRICQEALQNTIKHAEATTVWVTLKLEEKNVHLRIKDNGRGFVPPKRMIELEADGHLGLSGIAERAQAIQGTLQLTSALGKGTTIDIHVHRTV